MARDPILTSKQAIDAWTEHCIARGLPVPREQEREAWERRGLPVSVQIALGLTHEHAYRRSCSPPEQRMRAYFQTLCRALPQVLKQAGVDTTERTVEVITPVPNGYSIQPMTLAACLEQAAALLQDPVAEETYHDAG